MKAYTPRCAPARFFEGAPDCFKSGVLDLIMITPAAPLDFAVILKPERLAECCSDSKLLGLYFDKSGSQGCHFFLDRWQMRAYRERNRRKRVAWSDLPPATQRALVAYLES